VVVVAFRDDGTRTSKGDRRGRLTVILPTIERVCAHEPETPLALVQLVNRMLAKDPSQRPTAAELVQALAAASTPQGLLSPSQVRRRRWKRGICLGHAVLGAVPMTAIAHASHPR